MKAQVRMVDNRNYDEILERCSEKLCEKIKSFTNGARVKCIYGNGYWVNEKEHYDYCYLSGVFVSVSFEDGILKIGSKKKIHTKKAWEKKYGVEHEWQDGSITHILLEGMEYQDIDYLNIDGIQFIGDEEVLKQFERAGENGG